MLMMGGEYLYRDSNQKLVMIGRLDTYGKTPTFYWYIRVVDVIMMSENRLTVIAPDGQEMTVGNFLGNEIPYETTAWQPNI